MTDSRSTSRSSAGVSGVYTGWRLLDAEYQNVVRLLGHCQWPDRAPRFFVIIIERVKVVHRDVKEANILVRDSNGEIVRRVQLREVGNAVAVAGESTSSRRKTWWGRS